jgi:hypothetical protein
VKITHTFNAGGGAVQIAKFQCRRGLIQQWCAAKIRNRDEHLLFVATVEVDSANVLKCYAKSSNSDGIIGEFVQMRQSEV